MLQPLVRALDLLKFPRRQLCQPRLQEYFSTEIKIKLNTVEDSIPPTVAVPTEWR